MPAQQYYVEISCNQGISRSEAAAAGAAAIRHYHKKGQQPRGKAQANPASNMERPPPKVIPRKPVPQRQSNMIPKPVPQSYTIPRKPVPAREPAKEKKSDSKGRIFSFWGKSKKNKYEDYYLKHGGGWINV